MSHNQRYPCAFRDIGIPAPGHMIDLLVRVSMLSLFGYLLGSFEKLIIYQGFMHCVLLFIK